MKNLFIITVVLIFCTSIVRGQCTTCNIESTGFATEPSVSSIIVGQNATFKFGYWNNAAGDLSSAGTYPIGAVKITLSLPANLDFVSVSAPAGTGDFFNWTYDPVDGVVIGVNNVPIPDGEGEEVLIAVQGKTVTTSAGVATPINVEVNPLLGSNTIVDEDDDGGAINLIINAVALPVTFSNFEVNSKECALPELAWTTQSESNNKGFNIERASDEGEYQVIGFVESNHNSSTKRDYTFLDKSATRNGNFKYRIDAVDFDGKKTLSDVVQVEQRCLTETEVSIYPNPTTDRLTVYFEDKSGTNFEANILDQAGKSAMKTAVKANVRNTVLVTSLPEGVYNLQIERNGKITSKRFIKVN
jgi:hypothetical protein